MDKEQEALIGAAIQFAFEAGKWAGQVELEEHMDNEQYAASVLESLYSKNMSMPMESASNGKEVTYRLRSQQWRDGVIKSSNEYRKYASDLIKDKLLNNL